MIESFPLHWPLGYKRTSEQLKKHAAFHTAFAKARDGIINELGRMNAKDIIISSNVPVKKDGYPYAVPFGNSKSITDDTGIAVYFTFNKEQKVLCCDAFISLDDNMQAINKTIEALRGIDRWRCSDVLNRTFSGFKALPEESTGGAWYNILNVPPNASIDQIKDSYRNLVKVYHPDKNNGDSSKFIILQKAYEMALNK